MKVLSGLTLCLPLLLTLACSGGNPAVTSAPGLGATVEAAVSATLPTETSIPLPDINATIAAGISATREAEPTSTPTPDLDATVAVRMAATVADVPTPTHTPVPTHIPVPTATPTPIPTPRPTAKPRPTPTNRPTATLTPNPAAALSEMVKQARPAVVRIDTRTGGGSGVIFETQGRTGYVITNNHVVEGYGQVNVVVNDTASYTGMVRGTDPVRDLAVVRICCGSFRPLPFGDASTLEPGDEVVAIGYALGLSGEATITRGIVSAIRYDSRYSSNVIQTDAAINPGNSGGPMLSMSGLILGINTYRIDEAESGRAVEGLGFAISERTVQQRIPTLKTARPAPTPTPTRWPTRTPSYSGGNGREDGELRHNPSENRIKIRYAEVDVSDFIVSATFTNPYSAATGSWDYGFMIRDSGTGSAAKFITVAVTGRGRWDASWRHGANSANQRIADGTLRSFNTGAGGQNTLWLAAFGGRGLLFVNGDFISMLDLSDVTGPGDVAVITGAFQGDERAGAVTRYEEFRVGPLEKGYGPVRGTLKYEVERISVHNSGLWARDLLAEATFTSPVGRNWDYGFVIRNPEFDRLDVIGLDTNNWWFHYTGDVGDHDYTDVDDGRLIPPLRKENHLVLMALDDLGFLFVNGRLVSRLDLSHNLHYGGVSVMGGFYSGHTGEPSFTNFNVWTLD